MARRVRKALCISIFMTSPFRFTAQNNELPTDLCFENSYWTIRNNALTLESMYLCPCPIIQNSPFSIFLVKSPAYGSVLVYASHIFEIGYAVVAYVSNINEDDLIEHKSKRRSNSPPTPPDPKKTKTTAFFPPPPKIQSVSYAATDQKRRKL
ncbi:hypothetical protein PGB90_001934 [Kerria lacca]